MSEPQQSQGIGSPTASYTPNANTVVVGSTVISRLPDEERALLSKVEFEVLLGGDVSGARAGRDMFLGFLISRS